MKLHGRVGGALLTFGLLCLLALPARADVIYLTSGGIVKGTIVSENPREIVVRTSSGETVVPRDEIERVERGASPDAMYRERLKKIPLGDAEGHYQLGMWLKKINLRDVAREEFQKTIMLDPEHKFARDELGYVRQNDRWALPQESAAEAAPEARRSEPSPAAKPEVAKEPEWRPDAQGLSAELAQAVAALEKAPDAKARSAAWERVAQAEATEGDRLATALLGPFTRAREQAWRTFAKAVPAADGLSAKVPAQGARDGEAAALREELRPHLETYRTAAVKPAVDAGVAHFERRAAASLDKLARAVRALAMKDWKLESAMKRREKALVWWSSARDEAVKTIFDLKIYPDENHGRVGQPIVDEKVDKVRETWQFFDPMIQRDLARFLALQEGEARGIVARLDEARARLREARSSLDQRGASAVAVQVDDLEPVWDALVRYRAGDVEGAEKIKLDGAWEKELYRRVRDQRVLDWNESFRSGARKVEKGKQPIGEEVEQVKITNEYRIMMGRPALELEPRLVESARGHSEEMTRLGYFAHESPVGANKAPWDRMKNAGYPAAGGENISLGSEAPKATHIAWYNSSGHHRNILGPDWAAMGSGRDGRHWTQNFGPVGTLRR